MNNKKLINYLKEKKIGVICGGWSKEREISLLTAKNVAQALERIGLRYQLIDINRNFYKQIIEAKIDIAFIALHGKPGEDGTIQGFLELIGIPYTGSGVLASAIGMDKILTKILFQYGKIPTPKFITLNKNENLLEKINLAEKELGFPMVIKPRYEGSSVGVEIIENKKELIRKAKILRKEFGDIFFEEYIKGMIATCGILDDKPLPILELVPKRERFYSYKAKYTKGETEFIVPARLDKKTTLKIQELSLKAHKILGCKGYSRVDLVVKDDKKPYFLEINTLPGLTELSDLPKEAEALGISYDEVILKILKTALI
ncbi:MAG: D-alanine--D-alanine ligase [candidate division WOR-3 bacterium]|nr:D-alanine--D-alanine ligase [candidate division WOR-3 bacterium]MCX7836803.1 D-alanine--D-alanine ligase [candidate division WOR-3 bacterium]